LKKQIVVVVLVLAITVGAGYHTWALDTFTGTIAEIETEEEDVAITLVTEEGQSLILYLDPAEVKDLKLRKGDRIRVTAEDENIQSLEKLWPKVSPGRRGSSPPASDFRETGSPHIRQERALHRPESAAALT